MNIKDRFVVITQPEKTASNRKKNVTVAGSGWHIRSKRDCGMKEKTVVGSGIRKPYFTPSVQWHNMLSYHWTPFTSRESDRYLTSFGAFWTTGACFLTLRDRAERFCLISSDFHPGSAFFFSNWLFFYFFLWSLKRNVAVYYSWVLSYFHKHALVFVLEIMRNTRSFVDLRWCYTRRFATTILSETVRGNVGTMLQLFETTSQQYCNAVLRYK